jgi:hypothetical protein
VVAKPKYEEPQKQNSVVDGEAPQQKGLRSFDGHSALSMTASMYRLWNEYWPVLLSIMIS